MKNLLFTVLIICVVLGSLQVQAQNKRAGTAAATELLIPIGARDIAMGGATVATSQGLESIHWNPAGVGHLGYSAAAMFSSMNYIADIGVSYVAVGVSFEGFGNLALSVKSLNIGDIRITTTDDPDGDGGRIFTPTFVTIGLTYGRALSTSISVGTSFKLITEQIDRVSASGLAIDFGVQYNDVANIGGLAVGVAIKNIGTQMKYDGSGLLRDAVARDGTRPSQKYKSEAASFELPSLMEIGISYSRKIDEMLDFNVNSVFANDNLYLDEYKFGGEVGFSFESIRLFGRGGMSFIPQFSDQFNGETSIFNAPSLGGGLFYDARDVDITVDFAYRSVKDFGSNSVFSVKLGF